MLNLIATGRSVSVSGIILRDGKSRCSTSIRFLLERDAHDRSGYICGETSDPNVSPGKEVHAVTKGDTTSFTVLSFEL